MAVLSPKPERYPAKHVEISRTDFKLKYCVLDKIESSTVMRDRTTAPSVEQNDLVAHSPLFFGI